jgi:hypothetical protein
VDSADDTIRRFVVHLYTYDRDRRERRHIEVGSFDNEPEACDVSVGPIWT